MGWPSSPIDGILNNRWLKCKDGKELLALQASKEPLWGLLYILEEGCIILGRKYSNGRDKALRVTRCAR
jgi:hypothetical protein